MIKRNPRGNPRLAESRNSDTKAANKERKAKADKHAALIAQDLRDLLNEHGGGHTKEQYARWLNERGSRAPRGGLWTGKQVRRIFDRLAKNPKPLKPKRG